MNIICNVNPWTWIPAAWANFNLESWIFLSSWFSSPESRGSKQDSKNLGTLIIGWMMDTIVYLWEERWGEKKTQERRTWVKVRGQSRESCSRLETQESQEPKGREWAASLDQWIWRASGEEVSVESSHVTSLVWFHNGEERQGESHRAHNCADSGFVPSPIILLTSTCLRPWTSSLQDRSTGSRCKSRGPRRRTVAPGCAWVLCLKTRKKVVATATVTTTKEIKIFKSNYNSIKLNHMIYKWLNYTNTLFIQYTYNIIHNCNQHLSCSKAPSSSRHLSRSINLDDGSMVGNSSAQTPFDVRLCSETGWYTCFIFAV